MIIMYEHTISFIIPDNILYNSVAAASITPLHNIPTGGSYVKVEVTDGSNNTGTVTIRGSVSGADTSDILTFTGARWYITPHQFDAGALTSITTSGLADEINKPTVKIETVDVSGNPKYWYGVAHYIGNMIDFGGNNTSGIYTAIATGLIGKTLKKVKLYGDAAINLGDKFCIINLPGSYRVISDPAQHFQLGTDLIDYTYFIAEKYRSDAILEEYGYSVYSSTSSTTDLAEVYDADQDGTVDVSESTEAVKVVTSVPATGVVGQIILDSVTGKAYIYKD